MVQAFDLFVLGEPPAIFTELCYVNLYVPNLLTNQNMQFAAKLITLCALPEGRRKDVDSKAEARTTLTDTNSFCLMQLRLKTHPNLLLSDIYHFHR